MNGVRPGRRPLGERLSSWGPPAAVGVLYGWAVYALCSEGLRQTAGRLVYPLDDSYIHMAMAKNFALHHVWGVSPGGFSSSTTSPLWTAVLAAGYMLTGPNEWLPAALSAVAGLVLIVVLARLLHRESGPAAVAGSLLAVVFATSLPALTLLGMEHVLHCLLSLLFVHLGARVLAGPDHDPGPERGMILAAVFLPMARYEGVFAVAVVGLFLLLRRRFRAAVALGVAAALPLVLYGALSVAKGWYAVPNSVLLKGQLPALGSPAVLWEWLVLRPARSLWYYQRDLLAVSLLALGAFALGGRFREPFDRRRWFVILFLGVLVLHLLFAQLGWLYRYEAYLIALGLAAAGGGIPFLGAFLGGRWSPRAFLHWPAWAAGIALYLLLPPLAQRASETMKKTPMAMHDRYLEHLQPARFVQAYYPRAAVVANDIGALAYFTDCRVLDLYGLGDMEPLRLRFGPSGYGRPEVLAWTRRENAEIAILQTQWREVYSRIPREWVLVALWRIPRNVVFGDTRIGLFATRPESAPVLARNIADFALQLPQGMRIEWQVLEPPSTALGGSP